MDNNEDLSAGRDDNRGYRLDTFTRVGVVNVLVKGVLGKHRRIA